MGSQQKYLPIYQQFISILKAGFNLLDETSQQEIRIFVREQQHTNGAFVDRGDQADLYYSLFGFWLASALELEFELSELKRFVEEQELPENPVDRFSLMLIQQGISGSKSGKLNFMRQLLKREYPVNFSYQLFLFLLIFDARHGRKRMMQFWLNILLRFYRPPKNAPSSLVAALLVARNEVGLPVNKMQQKLLSYFSDENAFVSFQPIKKADMLSTGVALFALQKTAFDLRLVAPTCMGFIQQNFDRGAFLSGDGDETRDLEYTFYGLLALGSLTNEL